MNTAADSQAISAALLDWYDRHARILPWRTSPGERRSGLQPDPYHVWLSEVMLQQTRIITVRDYFLKFTEKWPDIASLAAAPEDDVMKAWAGLGYYSRARNLKKCADTIAREYGCAFPRSAEQLRTLPGIGVYTSAAIAAIAFDEPVAAVDGNVERVVSRLCAIDTPLPQAKSEIGAIAGRLVPIKRAGDFAQAMMDLGATICTPKRPACALCPIRVFCVAGKAGTSEQYPIEKPKAKIPTRQGAAFIACRNDGAVYLRKRKPSGLLGGMSEVPMTEWSAKVDGALGHKNAPFPANWREKGSIRHTFTHFHLELEVWLAEDLESSQTGNGIEEEGWWAAADGLAEEALPAVIKKAIAAALPQAFEVRSQTTASRLAGRAFHGRRETARRS